MAKKSSPRKAKPTPRPEGSRPTTRAGRKEHAGTKNLKLFKKGERKFGRQKGTPNKVTVKLKEAILEAAERSGSNGKGKDGTVGYLMWLSRAEPAVYGRMLEKVMPMQLEVKEMGKTMLTPAQAVENLRERGLPVPPSLLNLAEGVVKAVAIADQSDDEPDGLDDLEDPHPDEEDEDDDQQENDDD